MDGIVKKRKEQYRKYQIMELDSMEKECVQADLFTMDVLKRSEKEGVKGTDVFNGEGTS